MMATKKSTQEQIVAGFNELRQKQQAIANKMSELEVERREYELILETLKGVDKERRAFQMMGGVLFEKKAGEVIPSLEHNIEQLTKATSALDTQLQEVGKQLLEYRQKHGVKITGAGESESGAGEAAGKSEGERSRGGTSGPGLLAVD